MTKCTDAALNLPDQLLARYFRAQELEAVVDVAATEGEPLVVHLTFSDGGKRTDRWRDLGGGLGYVPDGE